MGKDVLFDMGGTRKNGIGGRDSVNVRLALQDEYDSIVRFSDEYEEFTPHSSACILCWIYNFIR